MLGLEDEKIDFEMVPEVYQNIEHRHRASPLNSGQTLHELHRITSNAITDLLLKICETNSLPDSTTRNIFAEFSMIFFVFFSGLNEVGALAHPIQIH